MKMIVVCVLAAVVLFTGCQEKPRDAASAGKADAVANLDLRVELLAMTRDDRELREGLSADSLQDSTVVSRMLENRKRHAARMKEILDEFGWPGTALVGKDGAAAAWLLVQHGGLDLQERVLGLVRRAKDPGVSPADVATLTDRVLIGQGKPQRYGTQYSVANGRLDLDPLENADSVDVWRAGVGLGPLADYLKQARAALGESADSL